MSEKVVLAYSGGLDTSVAVRWLKEERGYDVIALEHERVEGGRPLLVKVMEDGRRTVAPEPLEVIRARCRDALEVLPAELRALEPGPAGEVRLSAGLAELVARLRHRR